MIEKCKQNLINKGNQQENQNQKEHTYKKVDKLPLKKCMENKIQFRCISGSLSNHSCRK